MHIVNTSDHSREQSEKLAFFLPQFLGFWVQLLLLSSPALQSII